MPVLAIDETVRAEIKAAIERARKKPLSMEWLRQWSAAEHKDNLALSDRKPGFERPPSEQVMIPVGYRAAVSFEEQPAGMCMHLSVSVEREDPRKMPSKAAFTMIAEEFGISPADFVIGHMWLEEYEPGRHAVNLVVVTEPRQVGHA